jgi:hypothetical protein
MSLWIPIDQRDPVHEALEVMAVARTAMDGPDDEVRLGPEGGDAHPVEGASFEGEGCMVTGSKGSID